MARTKRKLLKDPNLCEVYAEHCGPIFANAAGYTFVDVRDLFMQMLRLFSPPVEHDHRTGDPVVPLVPRAAFTPKGIFSTFHLMTPEQQKIATDLYDAIGKAIEASYQQGLNYGQSLLVRLAKGEVRISDFEQPHKNCPRCGSALPTGNRNCLNCHEDSEEGESETEAEEE